MGFCECTTKFILFVFNLACALLGLVIITIGVLSNYHGGNIKAFINSELTTTSILFIIVGCLIFCISFFGCCGVARESSCMITTYAVLLSAILLIQIAVGVMAFVFQKNISKEVEKSAEKIFGEYDHHTNEIDALQRDLQCCGLHGPGSWAKDIIPPSCCGDTKATTCSLSNAYPNGCYDKISDYVKTQLKTIGITALIIAAVEFFCIACAFCTAAAIRRREEMMI